jgi:hypothetical protein
MTHSFRIGWNGIAALFVAASLCTYSAAGACGYACQAASTKFAPTAFALQVSPSMKSPASARISFRWLRVPGARAGVTGIFGAHVVAMDADTGALIAGTIGGWSCFDPGPVQFDGAYQIDRLPLNHRYTVYAEPIDGVVATEQMSPAITSLCRNATTGRWLATAAILCRAATQHQLHHPHAATGLMPSTLHVASR